MCDGVCSTGYQIKCEISSFTDNTHILDKSDKVMAVYTYIAFTV